jgi:GTPase SAR1 family protein
MKIAISGTANSGKTTLLKDFLNTWPNYVTPIKTYRDLLKERNLISWKKIKIKLILSMIAVQLIV